MVACQRCDRVYHLDCSGGEDVQLVIMPLDPALFFVCDSCADAAASKDVEGDGVEGRVGCAEGPVTCVWSASQAGRAC